MMFLEVPHLYVRKSHHILPGQLVFENDPRKYILSIEKKDFRRLNTLFCFVLTIFVHVFCCIRLGLQSYLNLGDPPSKGFISVEEFEIHLVLVSVWGFCQRST